MKKGLLFALALSVGTLAIGQNVSKLHHNTINCKPVTTKMDFQKDDIAGPIKTSAQTKGVISGSDIGFSNNIYTALVESQSALSYNASLNLLSYTHRGKVGDNGATSSGDIMVSTSSNDGATWSTSLYLADDATAPHYNRYPGGVIYNPAGNTTVSDAYVVYSGPSHDGSGGNNAWNANFFGSGKVDATNIVNQYFPSNGAFIRNSMQTTDDGKVHIIGASTIDAPYSHDSTYVYTGTFNSTTNGFDWTSYNFHTDFSVGSDGGVNAYAWFWETAFSKDGTVGYMWTIGRDAVNDYLSFMPIVWKTTNSGTTWTKMPVFDFSTVANITAHLRPMGGSTYARPAFNNKIEGIVDVNNELHLMCYVKSAFSSNLDSLDYTYFYSTNLKTNPIMDIFTTSTGWDARHLGDIASFEVADDEGNYGDQGWDLRLQASRTDDGTKVFATWTDSDTNNAWTGANGTFINVLPDLYVAGYDVVNDLRTNPTNFTFGTAFEGDFFFHYTSDVAKTDNGIYTVHTSKINLGADPLQPVTHVYMNGITFTDADFISNPGFKSSIDNKVSVSQNRPNPFNGNTQIDINLDKAANVSVEVINITGQTVYSMNLGRKASGTHTVNLNSNNLSSGIYFYTVTAGTSQVTKKMIVK